MSTEKKIRLLMVDDERAFLEATSQALGRRGIEVSIALNGEMALGLVRYAEFDVVLLDVKMPGMNGMEVFDHLRREQPGLPVIMLTGHGSISQAFETSRRGIFDYMAKPCDMEILAKKIHAAARTREAVREAHDASDPMPEESEDVRVLLVDDEVELLQSMQTVLERRNMKVVTAESGDQALEILNDTLIDVVVLDVKMPGLEGLEVLKQIKKNTPDLEVILLTGHPTVDTAMRGMKIGAIDYLVKPPEVEELAEIIHKAFARRKRNLETRQQEIIRDIIDRHPD